MLAFMNPGGVRADLTFARDGTEADGEVTYAEAFSVQPFGNNLVTLTLTGAQLKAVLEQQWEGSSPRVLQVSAGFQYAYTAAAPLGARIESMTLNGAAVDSSVSYRVTVNSFLANGGDGFTSIGGGTEPLEGKSTSTL